MNSSSAATAASRSSTGPSLKVAPPPEARPRLGASGRDAIGLAGYVLAFASLQAALARVAASSPLGVRAQALQQHPALAFSAAVGLALWVWFRLVRAARADEGPWPLQAARVLVLLAAFVVTSGPGWPGSAGDRPVWAGAILAEALLSFRPTRTWAGSAGLAVGLVAWLLFG